MEQLKIENKYLLLKSTTDIILLLDGKTITLDSGEVLLDLALYQGRAIDITADSYCFLPVNFNRLK